MSFLNNHRGPYRLVLSRPDKRKGFHTTEWLKGETDRDDVFSEAEALLTDPRDTITHVNIWSVTEESFVGSYPDKGTRP